MENRFGASAPFTIGVEEEFQLVDPSTRELAPAIEAVIGTAPNGSERIARELFQDCVEMRSPVFSNVGALATLCTLERNASASYQCICDLKNRAHPTWRLSESRQRQQTAGPFFVG